MIQTDLSIKAEINLYYDLYVPPNAEENAPLLIAVHGYGAHKHYMMREAKLVAPENFVIVSLQAPHQHFRRTDDAGNYKIGFGWLTDYKSDESIELHQKFIRKVVENLVENSVVDENEIHLVGFSQALRVKLQICFYLSRNRQNSRRNLRRNSRRPRRKCQLQNSRCRNFLSLRDGRRILFARKI